MKNMHKYLICIDAGQSATKPKLLIALIFLYLQAANIIGREVTQCIPRDSRSVCSLYIDCESKTKIHVFK